MFARGGDEDEVGDGDWVADGRRDGLRNRVVGRDWIGLGYRRGDGVRDGMVLD